MSAAHPSGKRSRGNEFVETKPVNVKPPRPMPGAGDSGRTIPASTCSCTAAYGKLRRATGPPVQGPRLPPSGAPLAPASSPNLRAAPMQSGAPRHRPAPGCHTDPGVNRSRSHRACSVRRSQPSCQSDLCRSAPQNRRIRPPDPHSGCGGADPRSPTRTQHHDSRGDPRDQVVDRETRRSRSQS